MKGYLFVLFVAALTTYVTTGAARRLARRIGAITPVRERDVHTVPIPRLGGVAIFAGIAVALITASQTPFFNPVFSSGRAAWSVLGAAGAVTLLGVFDDLWELDAVTKFAGQALAAGAMAWQGIQLVSIPIAGTLIPSRGVLIVLTVLAIVVTINAVNFVDGLDGLAAGIVAIAGSAFFIYSYLLTRDVDPYDYSSLASLIAAALVGACLGFLPHNFNPARIFMGDSGSMLIGLLLATSTVAITGRVQPVVLSQARFVPAFLPLVLPLAVLALPLIDLGLAVVRRTRAGRLPWQPDKMHLHHRMLGLGHSHVQAVLILYFWTATVAFGVALFAFVKPQTALLLACACALIGLLFTLGPLRRRRGTRRTTVVLTSGPPAPDAAATPTATATPTPTATATPAATATEPGPDPQPAGPDSARGAPAVPHPTPAHRAASTSEPLPGTVSTAPETRPAGLPIGDIDEVRPAGRA